MATSTVENYIKHIYLEGQAVDGVGGSQVVPMGHVARALCVTPGTATSMAKSLQDSGYAEYLPRRGVRLTESGEKLALKILRRHRLVELFLVEVLGLDWSEIHDEAEQLEHVISERVLDRIDIVLNRPQTDPHGDPIPTREGNLPVRALEHLDECSIGQRTTIARITDQEPGFLQFVEDTGLSPGARITIVDRSRHAGATTVKMTDGRAVSLGHEAARKILVEAAR